MSGHRHFLKYLSYMRNYISDIMKISKIENKLIKPKGDLDLDIWVDIDWAEPNQETSFYLCLKKNDFIKIIDVNKRNAVFYFNRKCYSIPLEFLLSDYFEIY